MRNPKLKPWLETGLKRFAYQGLKGLNVKEMSMEIETATSSFYHYFNTKEEYLEQLLEYWHEEGTMKIIKEVFLMSDPFDALRYLFEVLIEKKFIYECFILQLRAGSHENELFLKTVQEADKIRISFLTSLITRTGIREKEARKKATQIYKYLQGLYVCNNLIPFEKKCKELYIADFESMLGLQLKGTAHNRRFSSPDDAALPR